MSDYRFSVSLRIELPSIDPEEITKRTGLEPFREWMVGDNRVSIKGALLEGVNRVSYWAMNTHSEKHLLST